MNIKAAQTVTAEPLAHWNRLMRAVSLFQGSAEKAQKKVRADTSRLSELATTVRELDFKGSIFQPERRSLQDISEMGSVCAVTWLKPEAE